MATIDLTVWGDLLDSSTYIFDQAYHNMTPLDFCTMLFNDDLDDGSYASAAAFYADVVLMIARCDSRLVMDDMRPDGLLHIMLCAPDGSMVSEARANGAYAAMKTAIEAVFDGDRTKLLTADTVAAIVAREYSPSLAADTFPHYLYTWSSMTDTGFPLGHASSPVSTGNDVTLDSTDRLFWHGDTEVGIPINPINHSFGWRGIYDNGLGEMWHIADPVAFYTVIMAKPVGLRVFHPHMDLHVVPVQTIEITGSPALGEEFYLTVDGVRTANIDAGLDARAALADPPGTPTATSQLQIDIREKIAAITDKQVQLFWVSDKKFHAFFSVGAKTGGIWPYNPPAHLTGGTSASNAVGPDPNTGFDFSNDSPSTITRNDGRSWITDGLVAGQCIRVESANTGANDGIYLIDAATATVITLGETVVSSTSETSVAVQRKGAVTTDAGDNTCTFRHTGFTQAHYPTAEASYEAVMVPTKVNFAGGSNVTCVADVTHSSNSNVRYADLLDNDGNATISASGRDITHPKMTNQGTWINAYLTKWWQEFDDRGGVIDKVMIDVEKGADQLDTNNDLRRHYREKAGSSTVQGDQTAEQYHIAVSGQDYWEGSYGGWMRSDEKALYEAGTHYAVFSEDLWTQVALWHDQQYKFWQEMADIGAFLNDVYWEPISAVFPNVEMSATQNRQQSIAFNSSIMLSNHQRGMTASVGSQTVRTFWSHGSLPDFDDFPSQIPAKTTTQNFYPQTRTVLKTLDRHTDGTCTITCWTPAEIGSDPTVTYTRGGTQGFNGVQVGHRFRITADSQYTLTDDIREFLSDVDDDEDYFTVTAVTTESDSTFTVIQYTEGNTGDPRNVSLTTAINFNHIFVQIKTGWNRFVGNVRQNRSMLTASKDDHTLWLGVNATWNKNNNTLSTADAHFWYETEHYRHAVLHGVKWSILYNAYSFSTEAERGAAETAWNAVLKEIDSVTGYEDIKPLSLNQTDFGLTAEYMVSGGVLPTGRRVFRVTLQDFDPGLSVSEYSDTPAVSSQEDGYVDFITRSGDHVHVPGVVQSRSAGQITAAPYGWTVIAPIVVGPKYRVGIIPAADLVACHAALALVSAGMDGSFSVPCEATPGGGGVTHYAMDGNLTSSQWAQMETTCSAHNVVWTDIVNISLRTGYSETMDDVLLAADLQRE